MNAKRLKMVTVQELTKLLEGYNRRRFAGLMSVTKPSKMNVKDRDTKAPWSVVFPGVSQENVRKISSGVILMGPDYGKMVVSELEREGKDESAFQRGDTWHEAIPGVWCLRRHKKTGEEYLWVCHPLKVQRADGTWVQVKSKSRIVDITTGVELDRRKMAAFLPVDKAPTNQGTTEGREVIVRTYKLQSVRTISLDGIAYAVATK